MSIERRDQSIDSRDAADIQAEVDDKVASPAPDEEQKGDRWHIWLEIVITAMLALATVGTAWSGYQAARWGGVQSVFYTQAGARRVESVRASNEANSLFFLDVWMFGQWVNATIDGNEDQARFYESRFREEFRPAFDAWWATDPVNNPDAPPGPLGMDEYVLSSAVLAEELQTEAGELFDKGGEANQQSDDYILNTVILASVLFLAGIASRFSWLPAQVGIAFLSAVMLAIGFYNIINYPIA